MNVMSDGSMERDADNELYFYAMIILAIMFLGVMLMIHFKVGIFEEKDCSISEKDCNSFCSEKSCYFVKVCDLNMINDNVGCIKDQNRA